uniref:SFRICE_016960 n=1 Tax=Spodoptera frugiperda TaxID=7108 RepID=A0A2H1VMI8_SPOFR
MPWCNDGRDVFKYEGSSDGRPKQNETSSCKRNDKEVFQETKKEACIFAKGHWPPSPMVVNNDVADDGARRTNAKNTSKALPISLIYEYNKIDVRKALTDHRYPPDHIYAGSGNHVPVYGKLGTLSGLPTPSPASRQRRENFHKHYPSALWKS